jgi:hypothetical protein
LIAALVALTNVPLVNEVVLVPAIVPDIPVTTGADQVYVVLSGTIVEELGCPLTGVSE